MKTIEISEVTKVCEEYKHMLKVEKHHNHEIIEDDNGTWRWKESDSVRHYLENISLNDLCPLLTVMGHGKNSEVYRKLYRDMGYSLSGYYDVFYWDVNNPEYAEYKLGAWSKFASWFIGLFKKTE